jgi:hypothetical protein
MSHQRPPQVSLAVRWLGFPMTKWTFHNWTDCGPGQHADSIDHAIQLLIEHTARYPHGIYVGYLHDDRGEISCSANAEFSSLSFCPTYDPKNHSLVGSRSARRVKPVIKEPLKWVDSTGVASYIPVDSVLPLNEVIRALRSIFETHDFPAFIRWTEPIPAEEPAKPLTAENLFGGIYPVRRK